MGSGLVSHLPAQDAVTINPEDAVSLHILSVQVLKGGLCCSRQSEKNGMSGSMETKLFQTH